MTLLYSFKFSYVNWSTLFCKCKNLSIHYEIIYSRPLIFYHLLPFSIAVLLLLTDCFFNAIRHFYITYILFNNTFINWSFCYDCSLSLTNSAMNCLVKLDSVFSFIFYATNFYIYFDNYSLLLVYLLNLPYRSFIFCSNWL